MVGLVYTTILTTDNKAITIPNGTLSNSTVTNVTAMDKRMLELKVGSCL
ncbi:MAG: mechanosensitive ion channel domain-containing protein [Clostridium fessum]